MKGLKEVLDIRYQFGKQGEYVALKDFSNRLALERGEGQTHIFMIVEGSVFTD